ncbi:MAG: T9SS type A sorting domain-containing protein [candidate division Zixibacteria bacterium]|nr:T9SS type A sorting domain-containing protein [candidate division Zixibacteria bacterium]
MIIKQLITIISLFLILTGTANAQYGEIWSYNLTPYAGAHASYDFNNDSYPDLMVIYPSYYYGNDSIDVVNSQNLNVLWSLGHQQAFYIAGVGDTDNDSENEVLITYYDGTGSMPGFWLLNGADGVQEWSYTSPYEITSAQLVDIDMDGLMEIVVHEQQGAENNRIICIEYRTTGLTEGLNDTFIPGEYVLKQNSPNPFNPQTEIRYNLPKDTNARLDIYNIMGQRVATPFNGKQQSGEHTINWDASTYSSGIYFYKLTTNNKTLTKRMSLLK